MKALELANWAALQCDPGPQVAAELRRLAEVNAELLGAINTLSVTAVSVRPGEFSVADFALIALLDVSSKAKAQQ